MSIHGATPPKPTLGEYTPIEIETIPTDPRVERNRFGMLEEERPRHAALPILPGGHHMGEGSDRVSILSVKITLGGRYAEAGSKRFTIPGMPPQGRNQVPPALPRPQPTQDTPYPSEGSSVPVAKTSAKPYNYNPHVHPKLVMAKRTDAMPVDAEGDTPMRDTSGLVTLPNGAPVTRTTNPPAFGDFTPTDHYAAAAATDYSVTPTDYSVAPTDHYTAPSATATDYSVAPSSAFEIVTSPIAQRIEKGKGFHLGRCNREHPKKDLLREGKRYGEKHPNAVRPFLNQRNTRKDPNNKKGL